ncbi:hypothetical protein [Methylomonas albis]|nr:hypothetical protein [Methylomonas albis]
MDYPWLSILGLYKQHMCQRHNNDNSVDLWQSGAIVVQIAGFFALFGCEFGR